MSNINTQVVNVSRSPVTFDLLASQLWAGLVTAMLTPRC